MEKPTPLKPLAETHLIVGSKLPAAKELFNKYVQGLGDGSKKLIGIPTGMVALDCATCGLQGLNILAGIPGKGKSSFALQIGFDSCEQYGTPVIYFTLEMPHQALITKVLSRLSGIEFMTIMLQGKLALDPTHEAVKGSELLLLNHSASKNLQDAAARLVAASDKLYFIDRTVAKINTKEMVEQIKFVQACHNTQKVLIIIDYLQIFPETEQGDQKAKIDKLMANFQIVYEQTKAALLIISSKNRAGYYSNGLESLMGSAGIEYTGETVMVFDTEAEKIARENKGKNNPPPAEIKKVMCVFDRTIPEQMDLKIIKGRYMGGHTIPMEFEGRFSRFIVK